jgi:hypothetical protein
VTAHSGFARDSVELLDAMMSNGHMSELKAREAVLGEVDVETFVAFFEYAHTGTYKITAEEIEEQGPTEGEDGQLSGRPPSIDVTRKIYLFRPDLLPTYRQKQRPCSRHEKVIEESKKAKVCLISMPHLKVRQSGCLIPLSFGRNLSV